MGSAAIAHTLAAAYERRVRDFAHRYALLGTTVAAAGAHSAATRDAHRALCSQIASWEVADLEVERRDVVTLAEDDRVALVRDIARVIPHAKRSAARLPPSAKEHSIIRSLEDICSAFPRSLPRAAVVRLRRSTARLKHLEELKGPATIIANEAEILLGILKSATLAVEPHDFTFDAEHGFHSTLHRGLEACTIREPGAAGGRDLGLGICAALPELLGVSGMDLGEVHDRWRETAAPTHPWARYPYVPGGRFGAMKSDRLVRGDLEGTGPVGWAAGSDVQTVSHDLLAAAEGAANASSALRSVVERVRRVAESDQAIIGFIEFLPPEADGQRQWLIDPVSDAGAQI
jgi:hypothetical protein